MSSIARFARMAGLVLAVSGVTITGSFYRPPLPQSGAALAVVPHA